MSGVGVSSESPRWSVVRPLIAVPLLIARLPGNKLHRLGQAPIIGEWRELEARKTRQNDVSVGAIRDPGRATRADEVIAAVHEAGRALREVARAGRAARHIAGHNRILERARPR